MRSGVLDLESDGDSRRYGRLPCLLAPRLRDLVLPLLSLENLAAPSSIEGRRREDRDLDLRRPRSPGLKELIRRRVLRSPLPSDERESVETDRRLRFPRALPSPPPLDLDTLRLRGGGEGEQEGERLVDMVDTESADDDGEHDRLRSSSFFRSISSATPFLRNSSVGTSVVSFGCSFGLRSCCVLDGRDLYGRSCAGALHS